MANLPHEERTLVLVKPDGVQRSLVGEIITRFERKGLKIVALKIQHADKELAEKHYAPLDEGWCEMVGGKVKEGYEKEGKKFKWDSNVAAGQAVKAGLVEYMISGPVVAMVLEGAHAVASVRHLVGSTSPNEADVGTIRSDYTVESRELANTADRAIRNMIHASASIKEAEIEAGLWFAPEELCEYKLAIHEILYSPEWSSVKDELIND